MGNRSRIAVWILIGFSCVIGWMGSRLFCRSGHQSISFRNQLLGRWFYGSNRKDFFSQQVRDSAQEALNAVGTNAFPFLLTQMKGPPGTPLFYNKAFQRLPSWMKRHLLYPISADDVRAVVFGHLWRLQHRLSPTQLRSLAELVPDLQNPRLRMSGLIFLRETCQTDPDFKKLCRKLLADSNSAVQLEAAIPLAESAITTNPNEPRLAPILLPALESKARRDDWVNLNSYGFQQQPPGGAGPPAVPPGFPYHDESEMLRARIKTALIRLKPYLTPGQQIRFKELNDSRHNVLAL